MVNSTSPDLARGRAKIPAYFPYIVDELNKPPWLNRHKITYRPTRIGRNPRTKQNELIDTVWKIAKIEKSKIF